MYKIDSLLLGERQLSRFLVLAPKMLKLLSVVLIILAVPQFKTLYASFPAVGGIYIFSAVLLRLLVCCAELFRDRWFMCKINGEKKSALTLLAEFSLADVFCAAKLAGILRLYCLGRAAAFFAVPALCLAVSLFWVGTGVSSAVLIVLIFGNVLLWTVAGLFCSASLCVVHYAVKLTSLETSRLLDEVKKKITALDSCGFRLLGLRILPVGTFVSERIMAGLLYSKNGIC